jgi:ParB-like chromosome segregation protein Spo0J
MSPYFMGLLAFGWTREEIGEVVGLSQRRVGQKLEDLLNLVKLSKSLIDHGGPVEAETRGTTVKI